MDKNRTYGTPDDSANEFLASDKAHTAKTTDSLRSRQLLSSWPGRIALFVLALLVLARVGHKVFSSF